MIIWCVIAGNNIEKLYLISTFLFDFTQTFIYTPAIK